MIQKMAVAVSTARTEISMGARIVRAFNIYGRRMDRKSLYGHVMVNFIREALTGEPPTVNGDGMQCRSFCHIGDFIDGLMAYTLAETEDHVVNIGNPDPISIKALAPMTGTDRFQDRPLPPPVPHEPTHLLALAFRIPIHLVMLNPPSIVQRVSWPRTYLLGRTNSSPSSSNPTEADTS